MIAVTIAAMALAAAGSAPRVTIPEPRRTPENEATMPVLPVTPVIPSPRAPRH